MESVFFRVERHGPVAELVMNRPDRANAMDRSFWTDLPELMSALEAEDAIRAIVITGEGRHFTSGMDLTAFTGVAEMLEQEPGRAFYAFRREILWLQSRLTSLETSPLPVICAIHGACIGGGIDMITAADIRLASEDAYFAVEEINIGMAADVGTLQRLPKIIAPGAAKEQCFTGRRFDAAEARALGLINAVHADREAARTAALNMAQEIAAKSPLAIAGIKQALNYARDHAVPDGLDQIATWNGGMLRPGELTEAIQARAAKRAAQFPDLKTG